MDREPRIDRRGAKVYHSRMEARLRDAVDEVLFEWMRADGVLRSVEYEIKLSPDKRQALMYWSIPKPLESFKDVFGQLDDGASLVEKYLNRRVVQLRYDVTRRLNFKFSPEFLIFRKKKKGVVVDHTKKRKPRFGGELDDDEEDEYDE